MNLVKPRYDQAANPSSNLKIRPSNPVITLKTEFRKISDLKGISSGTCFNELKNGNFEFSEARTKMYRDWSKDTARPTRVFSHEGIFRVEKGSVSYEGEAYALCGKDSLQLHAAFFFSQNS